MVEQESVEGGSQWPVVGLFVSSTFGDMFDEREVLVKRVFPELRRRCRQRCARFMEVDLRWGLTREQAQQGKVIPVCLSAVDDCRPYFLGILGERYGWVPDSLDASLIEKYPWLAGQQGKSVTELEILHGALSDPLAAFGAFFYFRDPRYLQSVPLARRTLYTSNEAETQRLNDLKDRIRSSGLPVRENYPDALALEQLILEDLWPAIAASLPPSRQEAADIETAQQNAWAESRTAVYISREEHFQKLDAHVAGEGPPLVLTGESGVGKSALLANWIERYKKANPHHCVVVHYIGSSPGSSDHIGIIRRIISTIKTHFNRPEEIPATPDGLKEGLPVWLERASKEGRTVLVLDALNQLEDRDRAKDLGWLPVSCPPNVRVVVSTLPGSSLEALERRKWPQFRIGGLNRADKEAVITRVLGGYWKSLDHGQMKMIAGADQSANPLFLLLILEELRVFGRFEELNERIMYYLEASTVPALYDRVMARWEADYDRDRPSLVQDSLSLIWAARRGLSQEELLAVLGQDGRPLPGETWHYLYLAMQESLSESTGLITFAHDYLRLSVAERYLPDEKTRRHFHIELAKYFGKTKKGFERRVDELPWQLCQGEAWKSLKRCLCMVKVFQQLVSGDKKYELLDYWNQLTARAHVDMREVYPEMVREFEATQPSQWALRALSDEVAQFLYLNAAYSAAEPLFRQALAISESMWGPDDPKTAAALGNLGLVLEAQRDVDSAEALLRRAVAIDEKSRGPEDTATATSLNNLAEVLRAKGDYDAAEPLYRRALAMCEKALGPEHPETATSVHNLALMLDNKGDYDAAEPLYRRALAIVEKTLGPEHHYTAMALRSLAGMLHTKGENDSAEPLYRRALAITEKVLGPEHPSTASSLNNLAELLRVNGDYDTAEPLYRRALAIREKVLGPEHAETATSLNNLAFLLKAKGDYSAAEPLYDRALAIGEKVLGPDHPFTINFRNNRQSLWRQGSPGGRGPYVPHGQMGKHRYRRRQGAGLRQRLLMDGELFPGIRANVAGIH